MTQIKAGRGVPCQPEPVPTALQATRHRPAPLPGRSTQRPSLLLAPREHGAYGQLGFPLLAAHLVSSPTAAGWLLTGAAITAFLAHEPLLVLLGKRGSRLQREGAVSAKKALTLIALLGAIMAAGGLSLAPPPARSAVLLGGALGALVAATIALNRERTLPGELLVAGTLPAFAIPVAVAGGIPPSVAYSTWSVWALGFIAATAAVRAAICHFKRTRQGLGGLALGGRLAFPLAATALAAALVVLGFMSPRHTIALLPTLQVASVIAILTPHPEKLRNIGWTLVGSSLLTTLLLAV